MVLGELGIKGRHVVSQDLDLPLAQGRHLGSQQVKRQVGMRPSVRAGEVGIAVHILGEYGRTTDVGRQQSISEFVRIEALGEPGHVAALESVSLVIGFDADTPLELILSIHPDVLVKGGDWSPDRIVGATEVTGWGSSVHSIPFRHHTSTTALLQRIRS